MTETQAVRTEFVLVQLKSARSLLEHARTERDEGNPVAVKQSLAQARAELNAAQLFINDIVPDEISTAKRDVQQLVHIIDELEKSTMN